MCKSYIFLLFTLVIYKNKNVVTILTFWSYIFDMVFYLRTNLAYHLVMIHYIRTIIIYSYNDTLDITDAKIIALKYIHNGGAIAINVGNIKCL